MMLLDGAAISITKDGDKWIATVSVGTSSTTESATWPEMAIGRAIMRQARMAESQIEKRLSDDRARIEKRENEAYKK